MGERGGEEVLCRLHQSDCFGERALIEDEPRAASIRAGPGCRLYVTFITRDLFESTMGKPLEAYQQAMERGGWRGFFRAPVDRVIDSPLPSSLRTNINKYIYLCYLRAALRAEIDNQSRVACIALARE